MPSALAALIAVALVSIAQSAGAAPADQALTLRQLAGLRVIYSYPGPTPPAELFELIQNGEAGGVIFFGENITSRAQIAGVVAQLQHAAEEGPVDAPLLLMTDQEGGLVRRLPGAPELSEKQIGADPFGRLLAFEAGLGAARNLASVGMNVNLAPVLGVFRQPGNFLDQFGRSYSMDPNVVSLLAPTFVRAHQAADVAATAKHFPGLGAATASQNTDLGPVTLNLSIDTIRTVDERPYRPTIHAGVELVMTSWAVYPALDASLPAGLSPTVIGGELRTRLGFQGVTITDALEAGALQAFGPVPGRAPLAAAAGADLLMLAGRDVDVGTAGLDALVAAVESGQLDRRAFTQSAVRILDLRARIGEGLVGPPFGP